MLEYLVTFRLHFYRNKIVGELVVNYSLVFLRNEPFFVPFCYRFLLYIQRNSFNSTN